jgi:hypothetical protein
MSCMDVIAFECERAMFLQVHTCLRRLVVIAAPTRIFAFAVSTSIIIVEVESW